MVFYFSFVIDRCCSGEI